MQHLPNNILAATAQPPEDDDATSYPSVDPEVEKADDDDDDAPAPFPGAEPEVKK
jgi:hypothetical protein